VRIEWHPLARADLAGLVVYIATDDVSAAYRVHDSFREQIEKLATHPEIGRSGRVRGTRELVISGTPYVAAYRVAGDVVTVLRVLHGARRWPHKL
jgi:toxin ParE1/3/4